MAGRISALVAAGMLTLCIGAAAQTSPQAQTSPEIRTVRLAVGGKPALFYLPLSVAEQLGAFKDQGLDVEISDFAGGGRALQALMGGSADVVVGSYDHTIQMHAKGQPIVATVQLGRFPGFVLGVLTAKARNYRGPEDLKGMRIGVTAPGSSTHFMALHLMAQAGLKSNDAAFIGIGATSSAVAAVRRGEVDAIVNVDPVISLLANEGHIQIVSDTRTEAGAREVYGGPLPAASLYMQPAFAERNPRTVQALVNALVYALQWMQTHSPEEIAKALPPEYALGNPALYIESIRRSLPMYSRDGRFSPEGGETAYKVLRQFDQSVAAAQIDVSKTFTNAFVERTPAR